MPLDPHTAAQLARGNDWDRVRAEIGKRRRSTAADYKASFGSPDTAPGFALNLEEQTRLAGLLKQIPQDLSIPEFLRTV